MIGEREERKKENSVLLLLFAGRAQKFGIGMTSPHGERAVPDSAFLMPEGTAIFFWFSLRNKSGRSRSWYQYLRYGEAK